jgi:hypothetical protein
VTASRTRGVGAVGGGVICLDLVFRQPKGLTQHHGHEGEEQTSSFVHYYSQAIRIDKYVNFLQNDGGIKPSTTFEKLSLYGYDPLGHHKWRDGPPPLDL